ncbi:MAG: hypothetical protein ACX930_05210 [Erythrobacter sp.]
MTSNVQDYSLQRFASGFDDRFASSSNGTRVWSGSSLLLLAALSGVVLGSLFVLYTTVYSVHTDLAGIVLSGRLALTLGDAFGDYSVYFPPAERVWYSLAVRVSDLTGLRLDLAGIAMAALAVLFSTSLAYHIRRQTVGASPVFLAVSIALLVVMPILYKNVFGLREHLVVLGLWPYLVLRMSDPDAKLIGPKIRLIVGLWLGATLTLKYLYALVVLLIELADAIARRDTMSLFRIENLVSGGIVALYLFTWLILDPAQREAIGAMVSAVDANLTNSWTNMEQAAIHASLAIFFILLGWIYKLDLRSTLIGMAMVTGAIAAAWIQSRWYSHHLFPVTLAYVAWLWIIHRKVKLLWIVAVSLLFLRPFIGEFRATAPYQTSVEEMEGAMADAGISVTGKQVGVLTMHPSPLNQYLAMNGALRWNGGMNNAYVASELQAFDRPEEAGRPAPAVTLEDPGRAMLHDEMLRLWEDMPPDVLILDESTSWPLRNIEVRWTDVFANDPRFRQIMAKYQPVLSHEGEMLNFTVYVPAE